MRVEVEEKPDAGLPDLRGGHAYVMRQLMDRVAADAYHAGVDVLVAALPMGHATLVEERASPGRGRGRGVVGIALPNATGFERAYVLRYSRTGFLPMRRSVGHRRGWTCAWTLYGYTASSRVFGFGMAIASAVGLPWLADRARRIMQRNFLSASRVPASYILEAFTWSRQQP